MKLPFVSCICMTRNRRVLLRRAIHYFQRARQNYAGPTELVIVDGSTEPNPEGRYFKYLHCPEPDWQGLSETRIGHWTNVACEAAQGQIILKWDDDDWHHPSRIDRYVSALASLDEGVAFVSSIYWYHMLERSACIGHGAGGGTMGFRKETWQKGHFVEKGVEDTTFCAEHKARGIPFLDLRDPTLYIYVRHRGNTSPNTSYHFGQSETDKCRELFRVYGDLGFYDEISELLPMPLWNHPNAPGSKMHVMNPLQASWARHFR